jgi:hypothetical protein
MFPESNAPAETQPWVRDVSDRAYKAQVKAGVTERNAYAMAGTNKSALELISGRIANIDTFTTGLFEQERQVDSHDSYAALNSLPVLYQYNSGDFRYVAAVTKRIPFSEYKELTVTADGIFNGWTTSGTATSIGVYSSLLPMIMATIPPLARMNANGSVTQDATAYDPRYTVENFEQFAAYNIPGNVVPAEPSSTFSPVEPGYHPEFSGVTSVTRFRDNYTGYSMRYTREWLTEYMEAIRVYTTNISPPPAGAYYYAPDVDRVEIILGYYFQEYIGAATNVLYLNDNRLSFKAGNTFSLEGIRNMGY